MLRNDEISWPELERRIAAGEWHNIVISPGPGTPEREADVGEEPADGMVWLKCLDLQHVVHQQRRYSCCSVGLLSACAEAGVPLGCAVDPPACTPQYPHTPHLPQA